MMIPIEFMQRLSKAVIFFFYLIFGIFFVSGCQCQKNHLLSDHGPRHEPKITNKKISYKNINWNQEVIYFLLIDRFHDGDVSNNYSVIQKQSDQEMNKESLLRSYLGGDIKGVIQKLDYLKELGITTLWLSPLMDNVNQDFFGWWAYHGYHPIDFFKVEEHFGTLEDIKTLVSEAHKRGLKVILDMVYNQVSFKHPWVDDVNKWEGEGYKHWFHPRSGQDDSTSIKNWLDQKELEEKELFGMPDLKQENFHVYEYLLDVSKYWIQQTQCDGFRIDAVKHVNKNFWKKLSQDLHSFAGPNFLLMGEVFDGNTDYLAQYTNLGFNSLFDIPLYYSIHRVFAKGAPFSVLSDQLAKTRQNLEPHFLMANLLDNHDVVRFSHRVENNLRERLKLALTFLFTIKGIPVLYYGTEIALEGGDLYNEKGQSTDYLNRKKMDWDRVSKELKNKNGLIQHIQSLGQLRRDHQVFSLGQFLELYKDWDSYVFARVTDDEVALVAFNNGLQNKTLKIPLRYGMLSGEKELKEHFQIQNRYHLSDKEIEFELPPWGFNVLIFKSTNQISHISNLQVEVPFEKGGIDVQMKQFVFKTEQLDVQEVYLAGDFNGWDARKDPLVPRRDLGSWEIEYPLKKGKYRYKFVINGKIWVEDKNAKAFENDGFGGRNSIIEVK